MTIKIIIMIIIITIAIIIITNIMHQPELEIYYYCHTIVL